MVLARKGKKGWMSDGSQQSSQKLWGQKRVTKMSGSDTVKIWFAPILMRGKFHIEVMPDMENPGDTRERAEATVAKVKAALNTRFKKDPAPAILFADRGNGFYDAGPSVITPTYKKALKEHGLRAFWGQGASIQSGVGAFFGNPAQDVEKNAKLQTSSQQLRPKRMAGILE